MNLPPLQSGEVLAAEDGAVLTLTLNRPDKLNALTGAMYRDLVDLLAFAGDSDDVRAVLILGAGGAARAVSVELALAGASTITVVNRTAQRGEELVALLRDRTQVSTTFVGWDGDHEISSDVEIVVNTTSIGLFPDTSRVPIVEGSLRSELIVADIIPNPPATRFLDEARSAGCTTIDGMGMLVNQGKIGIEYWTGVVPDPAVMRAALESIFGSG